MIKFLILSLFGCPATLETENNNLAADSTVNEEVIPTQFGIIKTDNCDQKTIGSAVCNMIFMIRTKMYGNYMITKEKLSSLISLQFGVCLVRMQVILYNQSKMITKAELNLLLF